ncbi:MAG: hypothetical protein HRT38_15675 [Alteromonadaceae bacterium]|nr:hypothetical protein [Alteromonadaceae bacterium]
MVKYGKNGLQGILWRFFPAKQKGSFVKGSKKSRRNKTNYLAGICCLSLKTTNCPSLKNELKTYAATRGMTITALFKEMYAEYRV